jgi:hypothetical protein
MEKMEIDLVEEEVVANINFIRFVELDKLEKENAITKTIAQVSTMMARIQGYKRRMDIKLSTVLFEGKEQTDNDFLSDRRMKCNEYLLRFTRLYCELMGLK